MIKKVNKTEPWRAEKEIVVTKKKVISYID